MREGRFAERRSTYRQSRNSSQIIHKSKAFTLRCIDIQLAHSYLATSMKKCYGQHHQQCHENDNHLLILTAPLNVLSIKKNSRVLDYYDITNLNSPNSQNLGKVFRHNFDQKSSTPVISIYVEICYHESGELQSHWLF